MTKYETTFILEPGFDENRVNAEVDKLSQWVKDLGGEVLEVQRWGKRRMSYEIRKKRDGVYTWVLWNGSADMVKDLERRLRLNESVMRLLTVMHVAPELTRGNAEAALAAAEADGDD